MEIYTDNNTFDELYGGKRTTITTRNNSLKVGNPVYIYINGAADDDRRYIYASIARITNTEDERILGLTGIVTNG